MSGLLAAVAWLALSIVGARQFYARYEWDTGVMELPAMGKAVCALVAGLLWPVLLLVGLALVGNTTADERRRALEERERRVRAMERELGITP